jgi:urea transport system permease protein
MPLRNSASSSASGRPSIELIAILVVCAVIFAIPTLLNNDYLLNRIARYLVLGILAMSLSLSWGYAGILNLGQAMSFGLGSYAMAMTLKLKTVPVHTGPQGLPDFMVWNNVPSLPWFWQPFESHLFAICAGLLIPAAVAAALGWFMFRGRVTGVYVAIVTLAAMVVLNLVIIDQQRYTGGFNGITDLAQLEYFGIAFDAYSRATYYLVSFCLTAALLLAYAFTQTKAGLIVQAIRDHESRVRFFGYDVGAYQIAAFSLSAAIAGLAGMLYTIVMEFASPTFLGVQLSLSVVVWCAVGGRQSLLGAFLGAILVTGVQGALSESAAFVETWTLVMGGLFVLIVLFLPKGLAGLAGSLWAVLQRRRVTGIAPVRQFHQTEGGHERLSSAE